MLCEIVTYFSTYRSEIIEHVKLEDVLLAFKNGHFADKIKSVRFALENYGEEAYRKAKRQLPAIAFCGEFVNGHAKSNLLKYNNLLIFDIDHLSQKEMYRAREVLSNDDVILAFWTSPSGSGYKGLVRLEYQNVSEGTELDKLYKKAYNEATVLFRERFSLELDKSCSDYSRICYVCWDENLYVNKSAIRMTIDCHNLPHKSNIATDETACVMKVKSSTFKPVNIAGKNNQHARNVMSSIIKYLSKRGLSITYSYDEWLRVGFGIANTFNYDLGVKYFLSLCKLDVGKYNEAACIEKLKECYTNGMGEITLGTIIEMARNKGYDYKGSSEGKRCTSLACTD